MTERLRNVGKDEPQKLEYLYNVASAHPIEEYVDAEDPLISDPSFVLEVTWPRIVQFYMPTSQVCQEFKPRFIELAREIRHRSTHTFVEFHSVSCAAHQILCAKWEIERVPHVILFPSGSTDSEILSRTKDNRLGAEYVAQAIGIPLFDSKSKNEGRYGEISGRSIGANGEKKDRDDRVFDGAASLDKPYIFVDAGKSLVYSLQTILDIKKKTKTLTDEQLDAFHEWIELLHWALPSRWRLHNLINDIRQNFDLITSDERDFHEIIHSHDELIPEKWTSSCNHGKEGTGYACGIWKLFHILSIGVVEQHKSVLGEGAFERISTKKVAEVMRNFVKEFFNACVECQYQFLTMYDNCLHESCQKLTFEHSSSASKWKELAVWVWEVHNDINIKVIEETMNKDGRIATEKDKSNMLWPPRSSCDQCWKKDGNYDKDKIFMYLHSSYWPRGVQNPRLVVLDKWTHFKKRPNYLHPVFLFFLLILICRWIICELYPNSTQKKKMKKRKKYKGNMFDMIRKFLRYQWMRVYDGSLNRRRKKRNSKSFDINRYGL